MCVVGEYSINKEIEPYMPHMPAYMVIENNSKHCLPALKVRLGPLKGIYPIIHMCQK